MNNKVIVFVGVGLILAVGAFLFLNQKNTDDIQSTQTSSIEKINKDNQENTSSSSIKNLNKSSKPANINTGKAKSIEQIQKEMNDSTKGTNLSVQVYEESTDLDKVMENNQMEHLKKMLIMPKGSYFYIDNREYADPIASNSEASPVENEGILNKSVVSKITVDKRVYSKGEKVKIEVSYFEKNKPIKGLVSLQIEDKNGQIVYDTKLFKSNSGIYKTEFDLNSMKSENYFGTYFINVEVVPLGTDIKTENIQNYTEKEQKSFSKAVVLSNSFYVGDNSAQFLNKIVDSLDSNGNLILNFGYNILLDGNYFLEATLYDKNGNLISYSSRGDLDDLLYLKKGTQNLQLIFHGYQFFVKQNSGPYTLKMLRVRRALNETTTNLVESQAYNLNYKTKAYNWQQMNPKPHVNTEILEEIKSLEEVSSLN